MTLWQLLLCGHEEFKKRLVHFGALETLGFPTALKGLPSDTGNSRSPTPSQAVVKVT